MKKLFIIFAILAFATPLMAKMLMWDASVGAESYEVRYRALNAPDWIILPQTTDTEIDVGTLSLAAETRYEFQVFAVAQGSYSDGSDILRWTKESPPVIIEIHESVEGLTFVNP